MKSTSKKMDVITVIIISLMAMSIGLLNFDDLSWSANVKSYVGLIISVILFFVNKRSKK